MQALRARAALLLPVLLVISLFGFLGLSRLSIETDILKTLPGQDRVFSDALAIFQNHPIHDQIAVDLAISQRDPDTLVACGRAMQEVMRKSGLFAEVGMDSLSGLIPELAHHTAANLPFLFSKEELEHLVAPRLGEQAIRLRLQEQMRLLSGLEGIGGAAFLRLDPLGLKDSLLARLAYLAPTQDVRMYKGFLLSRDERHLLLTAKPIGIGTNTDTARRLAAFFAEAETTLAQQYAQKGVQLRITPHGAYRAALDNEEMIRHDVGLAIGLTTAGVVLFLLFAFHRPLFGLLALLPALAGTAMALFLYSLLHDSISILVLGFSGALISIMSDHSILYLLFLDQPQPTQGRQAAHETKSVGGGMAVFTTVGAFLLLGFSNFPIFTELGQFTALGFLCTYLFIHLILPRVFPTVSAARERRLWLPRWANQLFHCGRFGLVLATALFCVLFFFARPEFHISLSDMNTVRPETQAAEEQFIQTWGNIGGRICLLGQADSMAVLQAQNDHLLAQFTREEKEGHLTSLFVPAMFFPGEARGRENLAAWQAFWTRERVAQVRTALLSEGAALGFASNAFAPFLDLLDAEKNTRNLHAPVQDSRYNDLLGIVAEEDGRLLQFIMVTAGPDYDPAAFFAAYGANYKIFDPGSFSLLLGESLFSTFAGLLGLIAALVMLMLFLQSLDWRLTLLIILPLFFAFVCTLGTLRLIGHPLDIPGLMLSVVIFGMGVDYAIYTTRSCQWYNSISHPSLALVRSAIVMTAGSTLIGFAVLCLAQHATLRSVGIVSSLGIFYAFLGTCLLLPPLLQVYFAWAERKRGRGANIDERVRSRYLLLDAYPRMFARYKLKLDPLFQELTLLLKKRRNSNTLLDIGCGYGLPACWCLDLLPGLRVTGVDPDAERIRVARRAVGAQGRMLVGAAPDLPEMGTSFDVILLLDMLHYLDERQLSATLTQCHRLLKPDGLLLVRFVTQPEKNQKRSVYWHVEDLLVRLRGGRAWYRTPAEMLAELEKAGFAQTELSSSANPELYWLCAQGPETES